jgi:hypothetical protein
MSSAKMYDCKTPLAFLKFRGFPARCERDEAGAAIGYNRRDGDMVSIE